MPIAISICCTEQTTLIQPSRMWSPVDISKQQEPRRNISLSTLSSVQFSPDPDKPNYLTVNWLIGVTRKIFAHSTTGWLQPLALSTGPQEMCPTTGRGCSLQRVLTMDLPHQSAVKPRTGTRILGAISSIRHHQTHPRSQPEPHKIQWNGHVMRSFDFFLLKIIVKVLWFLLPGKSGDGAMITRAALLQWRRWRQVSVISVVEMKAFKKMVEGFCDCVKK